MITIDDDATVHFVTIVSASYFGYSSGHEGNSKKKKKGLSRLLFGQKTWKTVSHATTQE